METIPFDQTQRDVAEIKEGLKNLEVLVQKLESNPVNATEPPIDVDEVSNITGKRVPTIYGYVYRNDIPHSKKGNKLYFFRSEIIEWIRAGKRQSNAEIEADAEFILLKNKKG
ncbi:helix-turn-helix domain-containing protein [Zobellia barbeyronii]|uniref:Helix-turn-helix domain-containing protein n=1 Tax=Zobellia barbeyronii TaxID=2748009 RepID=A0ABS5WJJ3_9FLAO|nr:helix-turn-helix domain-containing protein [Zobellia barbeyronii]MBT2163524.1 helix-turn-helix domain-containing protein [Zobellia barbeyronii]